MKMSNELDKNQSLFTIVLIIEMRDYMKHKK